MTNKTAATRYARALLDDAQIAHRFVATEPDGATVDRVREAIDDAGARVVIYMGGDGTFAEVAKGVLGSANYMTAGICKLTNNQPASACTPAIQALESKLAS